MGFVGYDCREDKKNALIQTIPTITTATLLLRRFVLTLVSCCTNSRSIRRAVKPSWAGREEVEEVEDEEEDEEEEEEDEEEEETEGETEEKEEADAMFGPALLQDYMYEREQRQVEEQSRLK